MQTKVLNKTDGEVSFQFTLEQKDLELVVRQVFNKLRQDVKAAGFRPGKAPNDIVEKEVGQEKIQAEVIEAVAQTAYSKAMREHELTPIEPPKVEISKFVPYSQLEFKLSVEVLPPIKLADYKKFKKQPAKVAVSEKEIEQVVEGLRLRAAKRKEVKRAAKMGDEVIIDFEGKKDGKAVAGAKAQDYPLVLGSQRLVKGFEDALVGVKPKESKDFVVTFPSDYFDKPLAGQKVHFSTKLKSVNEMELPKPDDKFAKEMGPFEGIKQLRADITKQVESEKAGQAEREFQNELVSDLVEKSKVTPPARLVEHQVQHMQREMMQELEKQGTSKEEYLKSRKIDEKALEKELQPVAERRVKAALVMSEVAKQEKLDVTPEELELRMQVLKGQYQDKQMQEQLENQEVRRDIANQLLSEKTLAKLVDYAKK